MGGEQGSGFRSYFVGGQNWKLHLNEIGLCQLKYEVLVFGTAKQIMIMVFNLFKYLKDPAQPILDALDKDSSPKDDAWDSVSIVSFPENKQEDILQNTLNQSTDPSHQPMEGGP